MAVSYAHKGKVVLLFPGLAWSGRRTAGPLRLPSANRIQLRDVFGFMPRSFAIGATASALDSGG